MQHFVSLILFVAYPFLLLAQQNQLKPSSPDCATAIEITDTLYGPTFTYKHYGRVKDYYPAKTRVPSKQPELYHAQEEEQSAWFRFTVMRDTILTFDIIPTEPKDDYDFYLFRDIGDSTCAMLKGFVLKPVRACHSRNPQNGSRTGLSMSSKSPFAMLGYNEAYSSPLPVKAGETYYLAIEENSDPDVYPKPFYIRLRGITFYRKLVLENVLFETAKAVLLPASVSELDKLVKEIKSKPEMKVEISGHTDNVGDEVANQKLSEARAKAVVSYLIKKGIAANRLSFKGYGSTKPVADNNTEEGRKKNRRVEMLILSE